MWNSKKLFWVDKETYFCVGDQSWKASKNEVKNIFFLFTNGLTSCYLGTWHKNKQTLLAEKAILWSVQASSHFLATDVKIPSLALSTSLKWWDRLERERNAKNSFSVFLFCFEGGYYSRAFLFQLDEKCPLLFHSNVQ